jgi:PhnB protein
MRDATQEYYGARRTTIKDVTGFLCFVAGWFVTGAIAWNGLAAGFESGDYVGAMGTFGVVVFIGAALCGVLGLALGAAIGAGWETWHRRAHPRREAADHGSTETAPAPIPQEVERPFVPRPVVALVEPYVIAPDAAGFISFAHDVFAGREVTRVTRPDGSIHHAEVAIGDARVMLADPSPGIPAQPTVIYCRVPDCDGCVARAITHGATLLRPVHDSTGSGDRIGAVRDPWGVTWWIATPVSGTGR